MWDTLGRATGVPAADSGGSGALTAGYYTDDRVRQLSLDGRTHTYTRDPLRRTYRIASSGAGKPTITSTDYYADDSDEPAYTLYSDGGWSRDLKGQAAWSSASMTAAETAISCATSRATSSTAPAL